MTENVAKVQEAFLEDRGQMIHNIYKIFRLLYRMCRRILLDELNIQRIGAKFVLRLLSSDQREYCIAVCAEFKEQAENDPNFISNIITCDESWVFGHDPEMKQQSSQWKTPTSP